MEILTGSREDPTPRRGGLTGRRRTLVAAAVVAGLAAGATGVAVAQSGSPSSPSVAGTSSSLGTAATPTTPSGPSGPLAEDQRDHRGGPGGRGGIGGFRHGLGLLGAAGAPLHGEFVVPKAGGGFQTVVVQRGTVTAVSATSITLKSDDDFAQTYAVNADTLVNAARDGISTIKKDETATVQAIRSGGDLTAVAVSDRSLFEAMRKRFGPGRDGEPDGDGRERGRSTPSPTATGSAT